MISKTLKPKYLRDVGQLLLKKPSNTKFEVVEVTSKDNRREVIELFDRMIRSGSFTVVFVGD